MRYKDYLKKEVEKLEDRLKTETDLERKRHIRSEIIRLNTRIGQYVNMSSFGTDI